MKTIHHHYNFASPSKGVRWERVRKQQGLVIGLSNIYSFFGLPDPNEGGAVVNETANSEIEEGASIETSEVEIITGGKFHDLGEKKWQLWTHSKLRRSNRAIRYIQPDNLHRLPVHGISKRLVSGDMVVVDLRDLKHMTSQQDACRRELGGMSERLGAAVFALDSAETLLLVPGAGSIVDTTSHHLGIDD